MSASVDVLAVMAHDAADAFTHRRADEEIQQFLHSESQMARAAVAELIEKVDELLSSHGEYRGYGGAGEAIEEHMRAELVSALARVKGGAA